MKIALLADTHAGIRNDSPVLLDLQDRFYKEVFWPTIDDRNITKIIHLGDYYDRRKYINFNTLVRNDKAFVEPLCDRISKKNIEMHLLLGNHDTFYKNTNVLNSPSQLLIPVVRERCFPMFGLPNASPGVVLYESSPEVITIDGLEIGMVPWMCDENTDEIMEFLRTTRAEIIMGHFEMMGFEMHRGQVSTHGLSKDLFNRFDGVFSGHYHHKSQIGNIYYLGSPHEANWADYDDPRGFHIFDTDTRTLEFIENPVKAFVKIPYDDSNLKLDDVLSMDLSACSRRYVRIIVEKKTEPYLLEKMIERIQDEFSPAELKLVEEYGVTKISGEAEDELTEEMELGDDLVLSKNTLEIVDKYIEGLAVDRKDELKSYFRSLYLESADLLV